MKQKKSSIQDTDLEKIKSVTDFLKSYPRISVPVYSDEEIVQSIKYIQDSIRNLGNSFQVFKSFVNNFAKNDKTKIIQEAKQNYRSGKLVLVLGAGVSMSYGLPSWNVLLQRLMMTTLEKDNNASGILSKLFTKIFNPSPLIAGRYLQKHFENNKTSFEEEVRKLLYQEIRRETKSKLMDEIIRYCIAPGKSPNLNSIITYNFDDILEYNIQKSGLDLPYESIYGNSVEVDTSKLLIYHVHGYLPEVGKLTEANQITFGENVYHKQYTDIYSWNNIVQINKFRENDCLFIGTSLTDPNTRRLLDIANQQKINQKGSHYIFKLKYKVDDVKKALSMLLSNENDILKEKSEAPITLDEIAITLIRTIESFEENDLQSFGIKSI